MPEPKVGMPFGTMNTCSALVFNQYASLKGEYTSKQNESVITKKATFMNLAKSRLIASGRANINTYPINHEYKCSASFWIEDENRKRLVYTGDVYDKENNDVKFTKIRGEKYEAEDLNHNGVVDDDEIFEYSKSTRLR